MNEECFVLVVCTMSVQPNKYLHLLERDTLHWASVSAYLSLCARSSRARLEALWAISLPTLLSDFRRRSTDKLVISCWIPVTDLDSTTNSIQDVCRRGTLFSRALMLLIEIINFFTMSQDQVCLNTQFNKACRFPH